MTRASMQPTAIYTLSTPDEMKQIAETLPISVAMDASSSAFQFYRSGVIDETDGCGT